MAAEQFIEVQIATTAADLADQAIEYLQERWEDWEPNDGDLEVVVIESVAPMGQNAAETAAEATTAIFRNYGTKLVGLAYEVGAAARTTVTFTLLDREGHTIEAGTEIDIDGWAFTTDEDALVAPGENSAREVAVTARELGAEANELTGSTTAIISARPYLESFAVDTATAGGADPQDDDEYADALATALLLQARTLVTPRDYELWALARETKFGRALATNDGTRRVRVTVTNTVGERAATRDKEELVAEYAAYRLVNTVVTVGDATYTTVSVAYGVQKYPEVTMEDLIARIDAMLAEVLTPLTWGVPRQPEAGLSGTRWVNEPIVYVNKLVDLVGNIEGVNRVRWVEISGSAGSRTGTNQRTLLDFTGTVTGGTYVLVVGGARTTALAYNATAAQVREAILALAAFDPGDVEVVGGPGPVDMRITFKGYYMNTAVTVTVESSVTGGGTLEARTEVAAATGKGDWTMSGEVALPRAGTMTGNVL